MDCATCRQHLPFFQDETRDPRLEQALREHLGACRECRGVLLELDLAADDLRHALGALRMREDFDARVLADIAAHPRQARGLGLWVRHWRPLAAAVTLAAGLGIHGYVTRTPSTAPAAARTSSPRPKSPAPALSPRYELDSASSGLAGRAFVITPGGELRDYDGPPLVRRFTERDGVPELLVDAFPRPQGSKPASKETRTWTN